MFTALLILISACSSFASYAGTTNTPSAHLSINERGHSDQESRLTIAVVLAGGGAKGAAHVGVLKKLEELSIPIDIVTGTSMGAYVGGLYATGKSADEIAQILERVDWNQGYKDRASRSERQVKNKLNEDRYAIHTDLGFKTGSLQASKGMLQGQSMLQILRETTGGITSVESFDEFPIRYRAVATDIATLETVVLDRGDITEAMMASMSIPGILPPYKWDGRMLVDGGVTNNMPVVLAKKMGADVIIAVDVSSDYLGHSDMDGMLDVLNQLSIHMVRSSMHAQTSALSVQDIYLRPDVGDIETTDFSAMKRALKLGEIEATRFTNQLQKLAVTRQEYACYLANKSQKKRDLSSANTATLDSIVIDNESHYSDEMIQHFLNVKVGKVLNFVQLEQDIRSLYAMDTFELIRYSLVQNDGNQLVITVREKSWGPNYLNFRFYAEEDFGSNSNYSIGVTSNFTNLDSKGSELRFNLDVGTSKHVEAEYFSPITKRQDLFYVAGMRYYSDKRSVLFSSVKSNQNPSLGTQALEGEEDYAQYSFEEFSGELALGFQPHLWQEIRVGFRVSTGQTYVSPMPSMGELDFDRQGVFARYLIDTLDHAVFATKGVQLRLDYFSSSDEGKRPSYLSSESFSGDSQEYNARFQVAHTMERHTLALITEYGGVNKSDDIPLISPVKLGGFMNLSGIARDSLIGQRKALSSANYRYKWFDNHFGLFESPVYIGAAIEYGGVWNDTKLSLKDAPLYKSTSIYGGIDTPVGPVVLSYSQVETGLKSFYLMVGIPYP